MFKRPTPPGFPPEVETVFEELSQEVTFLHSTWDTYQQIFGTQAAIDSLAAVASGGFRIIQLGLRREVIMGISRITDPKNTGKKENLTLAQVVYAIETHDPDAALVTRLKERVKGINEHCEPIRDRRNREMGHLDLPTALKQAPKPLSAVSIDQLDTALRLLREFMNEVLGHFKATYRDFEPVVTGPARNIVHGMREFERLRKEEYQREIAELRTEDEARRAAEAAGEATAKG